MSDLIRAAQNIIRPRLQKLSRKAKRWWYNNTRDPSPADGGAVQSLGKTGLLERHGFSLEDEPQAMFEDKGTGAVLYPKETVQIEAAHDGSDAEPHTEQVSTSGVEFTDEIPSGTDQNRDFAPVKVRGRSTGAGHGLFHQMFLTSSTYWRTWSSPLHAMVTGQFEVKPPDLVDPSPSEQDEAVMRAEKIEQTLFKNLEGGWRQFVTNWWYSAIGGFSIFERLHHGFGDEERAGLLREMSFIYPSSVDGWLRDAETDNLRAVRFEDADGTPYTIDARHLLLFSYLKFGNDFEGISPLRPITRWIQAIQIFSQLEALAGERFGVPWITASYTDPQDMPGSQDNDDKLMEILQEARAQESPVVKLPNGAEVELQSAAGKMPSFEEPKRFALERVTEVLSGEASLIAVGDTGAFAARSEASKDAMQLAAYVAYRLCENLNGASNKPYTGPIKRMEDLRWDGPIQPGRYCYMDWSPGDARDPERLKKINNSVKVGTITHDEHVEREARKELDIPMSDELEEAEGSGEAQAPRAAASDWDGWLKGGLAASEAAGQDGVCLMAADDLDVEQAAGLQDRLEEKLAKNFESVAKDHKRAYRDEVRSIVEQASSTQAAQRIAGEAADDLAERFRPKYVDAARDVLEEAKDRGGKDLIRAMGEKFPASEPIPVGPNVEARLDSEARRVGRHAFNRQHGMFEQRANSMILGEDRKKLEVLANSTFASITSTTISSGYNLGRHTVVEEAENQFERIADPGTDTRIPAERSAVMDPDTCDECAKVNGDRAFVGSDRYWAITPPALCLGGGHCRCIWAYIMPSERAFGRAVDALREGS